MIAELELITLAIRSSRGDSWRADTQALAAECRMEEVERLAKLNRVAGPVFHGLADALGQAPASSVLRDAHNAAFARTSAFHGEFINVGAVIDELDIQAVAFEHAGVVLATGSCPGCAESSDIDLLVSAAGHPRVSRALVELGYTSTVTKSREPEFRKELVEGHVFRIVVRSEALHRLYGPRPRQPATQWLLDRALPVDGAQALRPEDAVLMCALHASLHSYIRSPGLRLHLDVDRLICATEICWETVVETASSLRVGVRVFWGLEIPAILLSTPVPQSVLDELRPPHWQQKLGRRLVLGRVPATEARHLGPGLAWRIAFELAVGQP